MTDLPTRIVLDPDHSGHGGRVVGLVAGAPGTEGWPVYHSDEAVRVLREALIAAEDDLSEWLACSDSLIKAGFNMDDTADVVAKARAALWKLEEASQMVDPTDGHGHGG